MPAGEFRALALALPESVEQSHMKHPDFRVGGKIFATLGPCETYGVVKFTPQQQAVFVRAEAGVFQPVPGGWGRRGYTQVLLEPASESAVREALEIAWRNTAPRRLLKEQDR